jgi:hypothetical protein
MLKLTSAVIAGCVLIFSSISSLNANQQCIQILKLPLIIDKPGYYCLTKNHDYNESKHAITINASHVTLDFKRHKIKLVPNNPANQIFGVYSLNSHHIIVKNGTISGFMYGVYLADHKGSNTGWSSTSGNYLIEHLILKGNFFRGIRVEGVRQVVRNNTILNTGGTTVYKNVFSMGVEVIGFKARIENNTIIDTHSQGTGENIGISFSNNCGDSSALGNLIFNHYGLFEKRVHFRDTSGHSFGIWVGGNPYTRSNVLVKDNRIKNVFYGVAFSSPTKGVVKNNWFRDVDRDLYLNGAVFVN